MLHIVQERFLKCSQRHLDEAKQWFEIADSRNDTFGKLYALCRGNAHLDMVRFWQMAVRDIHYIPGTWAYRF